MKDWELLRLYARQGSQAAFTELVARHLPLVYSAARRQVSSASLAQDITQQVFLELARNAGKLRDSVPLLGWLHVVTRRRARDAMRAELRRKDREHAAYELSAMNELPSLWSQIEPLLDEALSGLTEQDRGAVLLRYFENKPLRDVGIAFGISEDAAQKRVSRALEQLRLFFTRRGVAVSTAGFVADISAHAVATPPVGLLGAISHSVATSVVGASQSWLFDRVISATTFRPAVVGAGLVAVASVVAYETPAIYRQRGELASLEEQAADQSRRSARLTHERDATLANLAAIKAAGPGQAAPSAAGAAMAKFISDLRKLIAERPDQQIPELQLIEDFDYFRIAGGGFKLDTEENIGMALSVLRDYAKQHFWNLLNGALLGYLQANNGMLPDDTQQLAPYFSRAIDPAMLARYEMLQKGRLLDLPLEKLILEEVTPIDLDHDSLTFFRRAGNKDGLTSGTASSMAFKGPMADAQRAFRKANPGTPLTDPLQVLPYFKKTPDPEEVVRHWKRFGWPLPTQ